MNTIPIQSGAGFKILRGQKLKVTTPDGGQVSDLFCFNLHDKSEVFSASRSIDYNDRIYLSCGDFLYSNRSQEMFQIIEDTCGRHDLLMPPCSLKMFQIVSQNNEYHPSCHENLAKAAKIFDISEDQIGTAFNLFMNVTVSNTGKVQIEKSLSKANDYIILKAEMDLLS